MLDLSWIFPIKRAEGLDRSGAKERGGAHRALYSFFIALGAPVRKGKSREISSNSSLRYLLFFFLFFFSFFFLFLLSFPPSIPRYELATLVGPVPRRIIILQFRRHAVVWPFFFFSFFSAPPIPQVYALRA